MEFILFFWRDSERKDVEQMGHSQPLFTHQKHKGMEGEAKENSYSQAHPQASHCPRYFWSTSYLFIYLA